ncbi:hypothetical protein OQY15_09620 [Pedobacter sp. MC2016-15]|uniref:hypothetical protein n=1 Tax=Pedobacter sp. MC2016-15 TaxID=2994473 RepID=UPI00224642A8|nr:hypothetical protein [Pedobacter sp. MC2016-15]MCX2479347.1 hypothetical protein [Pedobacter sp. MC2016-15]
MKNIKELHFSVMIIFSISLLASCNSNPVLLLPGIYVNHAESEYSIAEDTLIVEHEKDNNYLIHRRAGFKLITDGKPGATHFHTEEWSGVYNEKSQILRENRKGRIISFDFDKGILKLKNSIHQRIN